MEEDRTISGIPSDWQTLPFDTCTIQSGVERKASVKQGDYQKTGRFPVIDQGAGLVAGYTDQEELVHRDDLPMIRFGDHTRALKFLDSPFATGADGTKLLRASEHVVDPKFLYFALLHQEIPSRGYSRHFRSPRPRGLQGRSAAMGVSDRRAAPANPDPAHDGQVGIMLAGRPTVLQP